MRATIDKVRKRLAYAVEKGELQVEGAPRAPRYALPLVVAWARRKWPGQFLGSTAEHTAEGQSNLNFADALHHDVFPGDLRRSHEELRKAYVQIRQLVAELTAALAEIDRLKPLAEKYEQIREKNRQSAKRPRGDHL